MFQLLDLHALGNELLGVGKGHRGLRGEHPAFLSLAIANGVSLLGIEVERPDNFIVQLEGAVCCPKRSLSATITSDSELAACLPLPLRQGCPGELLMLARRLRVGIKRLCPSCMKVGKSPPTIRSRRRDTQVCRSSWAAGCLASWGTNQSIPKEADRIFRDLVAIKPRDLHGL